MGRLNLSRRTFAKLAAATGARFGMLGRRAERGACGRCGAAARGE